VGVSASLGEQAVRAVRALRLIEAGRLGLDAPVQQHWPGFRAPATVRHVLSHQSGPPPLLTGQHYTNRCRPGAVAILPEMTQRADLVRL
jgi:CubicO group peptidase (beta-lactamase class C family)